MTETVQIHTHFKPEDIDRVVRFHQTFVAQPYSLTGEFTSGITTGLRAYSDTFDTAKDCIWLAEVKSELVGTVGIVHESRETARVRWLLAHPEVRDSLEKELLGRALFFCQGKYDKVYLLAATLFERLAPLAKAAGFKKTGERNVVLWGRTVTDEHYDLELSKS